VVLGSAWEAASCTSRKGPRHPTGGDERVSQRVRGDRLGDPGPASDPADDPPGAVPVQPPAVPGQMILALAGAKVVSLSDI